MHRLPLVASVLSGRPRASVCCSVARSAAVAAAAVGGGASAVAAAAVDIAAAACAASVGAGAAAAGAGAYIAAAAGGAGAYVAAAACGACVGAGATACGASVGAGTAACGASIGAGAAACGAGVGVGTAAAGTGVGIGAAAAGARVGVAAAAAGACVGVAAARGGARCGCAAAAVVAGIGGGVDTVAAGGAGVAGVVHIAARACAAGVVERGAAGANRGAAAAADISVSVRRLRVVHARGEGSGGHRCGGVGRAHIVGVVGPGATGRWRRRTPAKAVNLIVVGVAVVEVRVVVVAHEGVVGRHCPVEVGRGHGAAEAQELCRAVHPVAVGVVEPDAGQVDGHIDLLARVGVVSIKPDFVVLAVHALGPYFVDNDVCGQLVVVAAVYHQLVLCVERVCHACCLRARKVAHRVG